MNKEDWIKIYSGFSGTSLETLREVRGTLIDTSGYFFVHTGEENLIGKDPQEILGLTLRPECHPVTDIKGPTGFYGVDGRMIYCGEIVTHNATGKKHLVVLEDGEFYFKREGKLIESLWNTYLRVEKLNQGEFLYNKENKVIRLNDKQIPEDAMLPFHCSYFNI